MYCPFLECRFAKTWKIILYIIINLEKIKLEREKELKIFQVFLIKLFEVKLSCFSRKHIIAGMMFSPRWNEYKMKYQVAIISWTGMEV